MFSFTYLNKKLGITSKFLHPANKYAKESSSHFINVFFVGSAISTKFSASPNPYPPASTVPHDTIFINFFNNSGYVLE